MAGSLSGLYGGRGIALTHGEGAWVWGSDGRRYIDFFNGHGAALFGHANPVLTEALAEAARGVWSCGAGYESPAREELGAILGGELGDGRVFLCNSGTEAIEGALKLAAVLGGKRREIVACRRAFHGRSCGALGLTFNPKYRAPFTSLIPAAKHYAPEDIPAKISNATLAVFIEPVPGEGGVYPIPDEVGRAITESCHAHGVLLIADEVQSGLGRCGSFFASAERGLAPDIICLAKGLAGGMPAGAVVWRGELGDFPPHSRFDLRRQRAYSARLARGAQIHKRKRPLRPRGEDRRVYKGRNFTEVHSPRRRRPRRWAADRRRDGDTLAGYRQGAAGKRPALSRCRAARRSFPALLRRH